MRLSFRKRGGGFRGKEMRPHCFTLDSLVLILQKIKLHYLKAQWSSQERVNIK